MDTNYKISGNKLITDNFTTSFEYNIGQIECWDEMYVVMLDIPVGVDELDNVYGVDFNGKIVWRIESPLKAFNVVKETQGYMYYAKSIYVCINLHEKGILTATTFFSMCYTVDHKTGKLLAETMVK